MNRQGNRSQGRSGGPRGNRFGNKPGGGFGGDRFGREPREMHKATCSQCGAKCEVPFKPTQGKPVYCRDCYAKKR